ncbi:MAG: xanthine dehydrogenase family protein molybdopterin-binding subunit, partial [Gammaproteobacteria bacterium]|nr:xanthine dehydrogenase family protein molybdopterin-binding subunit [Gammaproteobacteria bacterium]
MSTPSKLDARFTSDRREFIKGVGGLTLVIGSSGLITACSREQAAQMQAAAEATAIEPNIWVTIASDDTVTIQYPATEMGQGTSTTLPMILADELDADWDNVVVETLAVHDQRYGNPFFQNNLYTAGSLTVQAYFQPLRRAGAQARRLLMQAAADEWGVPLAELETEPSAVVHPASGERLSYGELVGLIDMPATVPEVDDADLKPFGTHRYLGRDMPRRDMPAKSNGTAEFGIDVQVPGMVYASVLRAPVEGESPMDIDDSAALAIDGVTDIVPLPWGVAVVAETYEASKWGKEALEVTWTESSEFRAAELDADIEDFVAQVEDLSQGGTAWRSEGDIEAAMEGAAEVIEVTYRTDPAYHAQMEPMNATVNVTEDGKAAEIWVSTQTQSLSILGASEFLDTTIDKITLHPMYIGGGYGRRAFRRQKYVEDGLVVSRAIGKPVKVIWTREDDVKDGTFRNASAQCLRAGFDEDGRLVAWHHRVGAPRVLEFMNPPRWEAANGRDVIAMLGSESSRYDIPNFLAEHVITDRRSRVCAWRGVATSYTKFAAESFVDELAHARGIDPLQFRMQLCHNNPRALGVLEAAAEMADWARPRENTALGLGLAGYSSTFAAGIAEVSVDSDSGEVTVHNYWLAADAGYLLAPRNSEAQLEGNVIFGISNALRERIDIRGGQVVQSNYYDYPVMRMNEI